MSTISELSARSRGNLEKARSITDRAESAGRDFTSAENTEVKSLIESAKADVRAIKDRKANKAQVDEITGWLQADQDLESEDSGPGQGKGRRTFDRFAKNLSRNAVQGFRDAGPNAKSATVNTMNNFITGIGYTPGAGEAAAGPDPRLGVLALINGETKTGEGTGFAFLQEAPENTNAAAVVPDSTAKPVSKKKVVEVVEKMKFLSHLTESFPARYLEDFTEFDKYLQRVMARDLIELAEHEIIAGDGSDTHLQGILNVTGVQEQAWTTDLPTTLRKARTRIQDKNEQPSAWVVSAADAEALDLFMDDQSRFQSLREILGNLPVVVSSALTAGQAILGDWSLATLMEFGDQRGGIKLTATDSMPHVTGQDAADNDIVDGNDWSHNELRMRAEVRMGGLAVVRPSGFVVVDTTA